MASEKSILDGFYRNVPISILSGSLTGGRKTSVKQFPGRNTQNVEDLGLQPRKYSLEIVINDKARSAKGERVIQDYFSYRDQLIAALENKQPGALIHPLYGRIDDVVAVSYSLNESMSQFGSSVVSVNFEIDNNTGIPQQSSSVASQISASNGALKSAISFDIADNYSVTNSLTGNFAAAVDKINEIIASARASTAFIGEAADTLNEFSAEIGELSANVNGLVSDPLALADAITGLFESVNGLYASADATFDTFIGFFGFGEDDTAIKQDTAGRIERKKNNDVLNGSVSASSLGYAYLSASQQEFETTLQIDTIAAQLDDQYTLVQEGGSSQDVKDAATDMRIKVLDALDQARVIASQVIPVYTLPTTARLLAFNYYGDDTEGEAIIDLNGFSDVSFVEGDVEILTA